MLLSLAMRNLSRRKARTAIAIIAITIAASLYVSLDLLSKNAIISASQAYTKYIGDFDILITGKGVNLFFNATNVTSVINSVQDIDVASPRLIIGSLLRYGEKKVRSILVGVNKSLDDKIGSFELLSGSLSIDYGDVLLLDYVANALGVDVGDKIVAYFYNASSVVTSVNFTVVGIVSQTGKLPVNIKAAVFLDINYLQEIFGVPDIGNMIFIKVSNVNYGDVDSAIKKIVTVAEELQIRLGFNYNIDAIKASILYSVKESVQSFISFMMIFSTISILMAIVLIFSTINMNLHERIKEIGIMRSMGATNLQVFFNFLMESMILGVIGSVFGLLIGVTLLQNLLTSIIFPKGVEITTNIMLDEETLLYAFGLGLITSLLGGFYPAYKASKIPPAEAISPLVRRVKFFERIRKIIDPESPNTFLIFIGIIIFSIMSFLLAILPVLSFYDSSIAVFLSFFIILTITLIGIILIFIGALPTIVKFVTKFSAISQKLAMILAKVNILVEKRRAILVFFMLSLAVSSITLIGFMLNNQAERIKANVEVSFGSDIVVYANNPVPINETHTLLSISGVNYVAPVTLPLKVKVGDVVMWSTSTANIYGINGTVYYNASYLRKFSRSVSIKTFERLEENMTVIISSGLAKKLNLGVGDKLRVDILNRIYVLEIIGILDVAPGFSFTRFEQKASLTDVLVSIDTYEILSKSIPYAQRFFIKISKDANMTEVLSSIDQKLGEEYDIQAISTKDLISRAEEGLKQFETILTTLLYFAVIIAILGHITAILTSLYERIWEMGVLRSLGATLTQIILVYVAETFLLATLAYIAGLTSSFIVSFELNWSNNTISEIETRFVFPITTMIYTFLVVTVPAMILTWLVVMKFSKKDIATMLRKGTEI